MDKKQPLVEVTKDQEVRVWQKSEKKQFLKWGLDKALAAMEFMDEVTKTPRANRAERRRRKREILPILEKQWQELLGDQDYFEMRIQTTQNTTLEKIEKDLNKENIPPPSCFFYVFGRTPKDELEIGSFKLELPDIASVAESSSQYHAAFWDFLYSPMFRERLDVVGMRGKCAICCEKIVEERALGRFHMMENIEGEKVHTERVWTGCCNCKNVFPVFQKDLESPGFVKYLDELMDKEKEGGLNKVVWDGECKPNILLPNCGWVVGEHTPTSLMATLKKLGNENVPREEVGGLCTLSPDLGGEDQEWLEAMEKATEELSSCVICPPLPSTPEESAPSRPPNPDLPNP